MKKWDILAVFTFLIPLFVFGLVSVYDTDPTVSKVENRTLAAKPAFTAQGLWENTFTSAFEDYYADTFPGRESLISLGMDLRRLYTLPVGGGNTVIQGDFDLGTGESLEDTDGTGAQASPSPAPPTGLPASPSPQPSPSPSAQPSTPTPAATPEPDVDLNQGGYLIIGDRIMHMSYTSKERCQTYADMLGRLQNALPDNRVISMVLPNSFPFYAPSSQITKSLNQKEMIENLYAMYDPRIVTVDSYTPIEAHKDDYLYFRSDHHWTGLGAYWAYTGLCDALGYTPSELDSFETFTYEGFLGSFYREVAKYPQAQAVKDHPDTVTGYLPNTPYTALAYKDASMTDGWSIPMFNKALSAGNTNKYVAFTNGDQAVIHIETEAGSGRSIVVIKESFGNALIPFLLPHYDDIYVIDYRKFNRDKLPSLTLTDFVKKTGVQDVLLVSYCYVPNEAGFTNWIAGMMPR